MRKYVLYLLLILMLSLFPMNAGLAADESGYPRTITDSAGREVTIQMPVERIIVLHSDAAEAVRLLGDADKIVGITDYIQKESDYFPELVDRDIVGTWYEFDYEKIAEIALGDDDKIVPNIVVIGYPSGTYKGASYGVDAIEAGLAPFEGIAVLGFDFNKPETMYDEITTLGELLGKEDEAADYLNWYNEKLANVEDAVKDLPMQTVYVERSSKGLGELQTVGTSYEFHKKLELAGGSNICKEDVSGPTVTWEWVMNENPDAILLLPSSIDPSIKGLGWSSEYLPLVETFRDDLISRPGAESINAIENDRVFVLYRGIFFGLDEVAGLTYMAKILHPEIDLDPEAVYKEYLDRIGFAYPEGNVFTCPAV